MNGSEVSDDCGGFYTTAFIRRFCVQLTRTNSNFKHDGEAYPILANGSL